MTVVRLQIVERGDVLARDDQNMVRCLGVNVMEGDYMRVFVEEVGLDFAIGDIAEHAAHCVFPPVYVSRLLTVKLLSRQLMKVKADFA